MSWTWQRHDLGFPGAIDPWIEWRLQRNPVNRMSRQVLCERSERLTPQTMRTLGWRVPSAYGDDAAFFTARCAPGVECRLPHGATGFVAGDDDVSAQPTAEQRSATASAPTPASNRATAPSGRTTVLAVIDADIAFLHQQFRDAAGRSRVRAHWDQGNAATSAPWQRPDRIGYGREMLGADIDAALSADASERATYERLGVKLPGSGWAHGTQVLALAAGRTPHSSDAAAALPLLTVSVPRGAFAQTHGLWLNVYLLDALHFILSHVGRDESVVVNVSLGAHSGPHDGRSLLERALDQLIDAQQGRLTVVLAAGNSRLVRAHARASWPAGSAAQSLSAAIEMTGDDPTPNFVEAWVEGRAGDARFEVTPPTSVAPPSGGLTPGQCATLRDSEGSVVAMAYCGVVQGDAAQTQSLQALMAVAATRGPDGTAPGTARAGAWSLRVSTGDETTVRLWVARDDSIDYGLEPKAFSQVEPADAVSVADTMSSICGARRAIVVGGYVLAAADTPAMYESSGEAAVGDAVSGRTAPDLCALARLPPTRWIGCFSDEAPPAPWLLEGTSIAAPYAARALANLTAQLGAQTRDVLLHRLRQPETSLSVTPTDRVSWTSTYWLRCE